MDIKENGDSYSLSSLQGKQEEKQEEENKEDLVNIEELLKICGEFGFYQKRLVLILLSFSLISPFQTMSMAFIGANVPFYCLPPSYNISVLPSGFDENLFLSHLNNPNNPCQVYNVSFEAFFNSNTTNQRDKPNKTATECNYGRKFDIHYRSTVVSEFGLVCEKNWLKSASKSVFFVGRLIGAGVFGQLADRFGRRPCFFIGTILLSICGIINAFIPSFLLFLIFYFFQGVWQVGSYFCAYTIAIEIVPVNYRMSVNSILHTTYALGMMLLSGIAYLIKDWRHLEIAISMPFIFFVFCWRIIPESPRWLITQNKYRECKETLEKIARTNGMKIEIDCQSLQKLIQKKDSVKVKIYTILDLIKTWSAAKISLNVWFNWFVNSMVYYGVTLNAVDMAGNPYLNFVAMAAVEIPAYVLTILTSSYFGRRLPLFFYMLFGGFNCLATIFVPQSPSWIPLTLALLGKFGCSASYGTIYLVAAEIFPTVTRNLGIGMSSMFSRIGGLLAPFILDLVFFLSWLPFSIFGILSISFGILTLFLPETSKSHLPQTWN